MRARTAKVSRRELRALLLEAAVHPVADPRSGFVDGLGSQLVRQGAPGRLIALPRRARRTRVPALVTGVAAAAAAAVLIGALTGVYGRGVEDRALALAVAVDTTVQLPDGSLITGARGITLPDGAVVRTGPNGRCSAGDVDLGPGIEALVDSGRLRLRSADPEGGTPIPLPGDAAAQTASAGPPVTVPLVVPEPTTPSTRPGVPALSPGHLTPEPVGASTDSGSDSGTGGAGAGGSGTEWGSHDWSGSGGSGYGGSGSGGSGYGGSGSDGYRGR